MGLKGSVEPRVGGGHVICRDTEKYRGLVRTDKSMIRIGRILYNVNYRRSSVFLSL